MFGRRAKTGTAIPRHVVFQREGADSCEVFSGNGSVERIQIGSDDLDEALRLAKQVNLWTFANGQRVSEHITADGFEPWWFIQEYIFWRCLVPYVRYRPVLQRVLDGEACDFHNAPPALRHILKLLSRPGNPRISFFSAATISCQTWLTLALRIIDSAKRKGALCLLALIALVSVLLFRLLQRPVLLYTIDKVSPGLRHDFRIDAIYQELESRGWKYGEYVHFGQVGVLGRLLRRGRAVVYFEAVAQILHLFLSRQRPFPALPPGGLNVDRSNLDTRFLSALALHALHTAWRAALRYDATKLLVRIHGPKLALILDDSRYSHELVAACKELGVFVVSYQHGLAFDQYFTGLMCYGFGRGRRHDPDAHGFWSEHFRQLLLGHTALYQPGKTFVCGMLRPPTPDELSEITLKRNGRNGKIRVLVISEPLSPVSEKVPYVLDLMNADRFEVCLKLRPGESVDDVRRDWGELFDRLKLVITPTVYAAFAYADVIVGMYSSVLYEALLVHKPVLVPAPGSSLGRRLLSLGVAGWVPSPIHMQAAVLRAVTIPNEELIRRSEVIWGTQPGLGGASVLLDVVAEHLSCSRKPVKRKSVLQEGNRTGEN